jgi:hypothetical protein
MSSEQIDGSEIDARSDLFRWVSFVRTDHRKASICVRDSVPATFFATINQDYLPLKQLRMDVPTDLEYVVTCLLKSSKNERLSSASDLISLLN